MYFCHIFISLKKNKIKFDNLFVHIRILDACIIALHMVVSIILGWPLMAIFLVHVDLHCVIILDACTVNLEIAGRCEQFSWLVSS